jgi:hypothetical protein
MEVSEGELQLAIGSNAAISTSAFNELRSNIDDLQNFLTGFGFAVSRPSRLVFSTANSTTERSKTATSINSPHHSESSRSMNMPGKEPIRPNLNAAPPNPCQMLSSLPRARK